jgi:hypothetical protein
MPTKMTKPGKPGPAKNQTSDRVRQAGRDDRSIRLRLLLLGLLYIALVVIFGATVTLFPGGSVFNLLDPQALLAEARNWTLEQDGLRIGVVLIITVMPLFALRVAGHARASMKRERLSAELAIIAIQQMIENGAYRNIGEFSAKGFMELVAKNGVMPPTTSELHRLLGTVSTKALQLRQEPTASVLQGYREYFSGLVGATAPYQRVSLQVGILFTFVGLTLAFAKADMSLIADNQSQRPLAALFGALNIAFGTSMAGVTASIFVILFTSPLRRLYQSTMQSFERCVEQIYNFGKLVPANPDYIDHIDQVAEALRGHARSADGLLRQTADMNETIRVGIGAFTQTRERYEQALRAMAEEQTRLLTSFNLYVDVLKPERLGDEARQLSQAVIQPLSDQLYGTNVALERSERLFDQLATLVTELANQQQTTMADLAEIRDHLSAMRQNPPGKPDRPATEGVGEASSPPRRPTRNWFGWLRRPDGSP